MATASSSSSAPRPPPPSPSAQDIESHYNLYVAHNKRVPDISGGWSWEPYLKSLIEEELKYPQNKSVFEEPSSDSSDSSDSETSDDGDPADNAQLCEGTGGKPDDTLFDDEDFNWTNDKAWIFFEYVPTWTDPRFDPDWKHVYSFRPRPIKHLPSRNLLMKLRPALRAEDLVRQPTPHAMRWGIFPDRSDGRSRMSPTFSNTRDYNAGIRDRFVSLLDEETRSILLQETHTRLQLGNTTYDGEGIAPEVIDEFRRYHNIPGQAEFVQSAFNSGPFERFARNLPAGFNPEMYKDMIADIQGDEDYQRLVFSNWTTDELTRNGIHTMSNDEQCTLTDEPLHELLSKERWIDTGYTGDAGRKLTHPRLVYDLDGQMQEYNVHRNDELWSALQPALQLASRILKTKPPFWSALKDLRTRTAIPEEHDPRPEEDRPTVRLNRIRLLDEALAEDADRDWPILYELADQGLDYEAAVDFVLEQRLSLEFSSGYFSTTKFDHKRFAYGFTASNAQSPARRPVRCYISTEIVWPLLAKSFSSSEKLSASFLIAVTILHELMHATQSAVNILCKRNEKLWIPNVTKHMAFELDRWHTANYDPDTAHGEPWFGTDLHAEVGWAFESSFWGVVVRSFTSHEHHLSHHVMLLPIMLACDTYPSNGFELDNNNVLKDVCQKYTWTTATAVPIELFAKFFTQAFWDEVVPTQGVEAFRKKDPDRTQLYIMERKRANPVSVEHVFGHENKQFFMFVLRTLSRFGYSVLHTWLNQTLAGAIADVDSCTRWRVDMQGWEGTDDPWDEAVNDMEHVKRSGDAMWHMLWNLTPEAYRDWALEWDSLGTRQPCPDYGSWVYESRRRFTEHFREGGAFFRGVVRLHELARVAVPEMELMVFEFLTLSWQSRIQHYNTAVKGPPNPIPMLLSRMAKYREPMRRMSTALDALSDQHVFPAAEPEQCRLWSARFQALVKLLDHMEWMVRAHAERTGEVNRNLRESLPSVPSAFWEEPEHRFREMGLREYQLVSQPIRAVIDEFDRRLNEVLAGRTQGRELSQTGQTNVVAKQQFDEYRLVHKEYQELRQEFQQEQMQQQQNQASQHPPPPQ